MDNKKKPDHPDLPTGPDQEAYQRKVIVRFREHIQVPPSADPQDYIERSGLGGWRTLNERFPELRLRRLFTSLSPDQIEKLTEQAHRNAPPSAVPNLLAYFYVDYAPGEDPEAIAAALRELEGVETAYVEGGPVPPPLVNAGNDPRSVNQGYLDPAPNGIDAEFAWTVAGGDGTGVLVVDLERGWTLTHEDLTTAGITLISGVSQDFFGHGTAVLGELVAVDNTLGCVGIAPNATARVVSQWRTAANYNTADAIVSAISVMNFGDVLLLEAQTSFNGFFNVPVEVEDAVFDAIRLATALGMVIVEAAGNGGVDLDTLTDLMGRQILNRASADFRDSGAIVVGAASSMVPHTRLGFSCFGSRIDCFGWGENIDTTGDGWTGNLTTTYTTAFGGTSGASPIVTGAAILVQSIADATLGYRYSPLQLRAILAAAANGTASANPAVDRIGVMPNLQQIITTVMNAVPDVYLRDFVGDVGDPHLGPISSSPDIILRPTPVANPQAAFGQGSGTENNDGLGSEAEAGQDNAIYVRVRNRGGAAAANVNVDIYWAPPSTLVTPNLWNLVGSVTIPNVPTGNVLTVSDALPWLSGAIPATGHYCFVGVLGFAADPAPNPANFLVWDNFISYIRDQNNVTWRNFNVVNNTPPAHMKQIALPFFVPGAPKESVYMRLKVLAQLPREASIYLEMPRYMFDAFRERNLPEKRVPDRFLEGKRETVRLPITPFQPIEFPDIPFPAGSMAKLTLHVDIPEKYREGEYDLSVLHLYKDMEVGRITWRFAPEKRVRDPKWGRLLQLEEMA